MDWWLPENISSYGGSVDTLFYVILALTAIALVLVQAALLYFLVRYRHKDGEKAVYVHGNRRMEIIWTVIPALILFSLALFQTGTWLDIKQRFPGEDQSVVVRVMPEQFEWQAQYPGADGELDTDDDVFPPVNVIHVPVNERVLVLLESQDVIHSFFVPELRAKQDAVPGMTTRLWFEATRTGEYDIQCAELCGLGHYRMRGRLTIESTEDFEAWLQEVQASE